MIGNYDPSIKSKRRLFMSRQIEPNVLGHSHENPILPWVRSEFKELGYSVLGAVKEGHAIAYHEERGELVLVNQLNADKKGDFDQAEIWLGTENLGLFTFKQIEAIMNGENAKQGYPDWRMFDKGYYQAIRKIKSDWEGFIKILQDNKDDESSAKALAAKYSIPEADAKKLLQLTLAKMTMMGDEYVEERIK